MADMMGHAASYAYLTLNSLPISSSLSFECNLVSKIIIFS